eukprot:FR742243.1.p1 GENE.FR742243.1~~FR742243.1.p1  ORF type:complete len:223 (+),score=20.03 FR742243.1:63-671(+)
MMSWPVDILRSCACAAAEGSYQHNRTSTVAAYGIYKIAFQNAMKEATGSSNGTTEALGEARKNVGRLHCDLFHNAPSIDAAIDQLQTILQLLKSAAAGEVGPALFRAEDIECVLFDVYNWGLRYLDMGMGARSEHLLGLALQLLPHTHGRHHEGVESQAFNNAYQQALSCKEKEANRPPIHPIEEEQRAQQAAGTAALSKSA